jgi:hypothetical protein
VHAVADASAYEPGAHATMSALSGKGHAFPGAQAWHTDVPAAAMAPDGQATGAAERPVHAKPAAQSVQLLAPPPIE